MKVRSTPWGKAQYIEAYQRGISLVTTASHGGYLVAVGYAQKHLSEQARSVGVPWYGYLAYEEDCLAAVVDLELLQRDGQGFLEWRCGTKDRISIKSLRSEVESIIKKYIPTYKLKD